MKISIMKNPFKAITLGMLVAMPSALMAQTVVKQKNGVKVDFNGKPTTELTVYSSNIVRVTKYADGLDQMPQKKSYSVVLTPGKEKFTVDENASSVVLKTDNVIASINKLSGAVSFSNHDGELLLKEGDKYEVKAIASGVDKGKYSISQEFDLEKNEAIFGFGQRKSKKLNQRGENIDLWNANTNINIPFFSSEKGYGLYWDNAGRSRFNDSEGETMFSSQVAQGIDYYFMYEDGSQDGVIASVRDLSGQATMFPLWTMGYWQCRERYKTSDELCGILDKMRELRIPIDGIVQDWQYWGCDSNWNAMKFMNPYYINKVGDKQWAKYLPDDLKPLAAEYVRKGMQPRIKSPQEMIDYVHKNNAHLMISIWASFGPWTDQYRELDEIGALYPFDTWPRNRGVKPYDAFNPKARDIYWKYLKNLYDMGIDAWWTDSTEPDHFDEKPSDFDHQTHDGSWVSVKNAFSLATNKGIYENQRATKGNSKRSFQMTRSGAFGIQHYGTFSWSGDISSNWETMKNQIPSGLNFIACGIPYWNTDIGGFFCWDDDNNPKSPHAQEIQVRWMQWGCFMPLMRNHVSSPMINELWNYADPGHWAFDVQKKYIELRYRLLPYIYSNCGDITQRSGSMMRPLFFDFTDDRRAINLTDEYLFGRNILVKPVTDPLYTFKDENKKGYAIYPEVEKAAAPVNVYLPKGTDWYDFWTNKRIKGGKHIQRLAPIDIMPVYVKAGSIIPFGPAVQYSNEQAWDNLEIRVYPGADGTFILYEDEGDNYNYEKGQFSEITFKWDEAHGKLTISDRKGSYKGMLKSRKFRILLVDGKSPSGDVEPAAFTEVVEYNGKAVEVKLAEGTLPDNYEDFTRYIKNPSFEDDDRQLTKREPQGWTVNSQTNWWGVNRAGGNGDPEATDGNYIFGVWDGSNTMSPSISQTISNLPKGNYIISVDIHASNTGNAVRVGKQRIFANDAVALFADKITEAGKGDNYPMQTLSLKFTQKTDNAPLKIGVATDGAPSATWFKIDNFRLYRLK